MGRHMTKCPFCGEAVASRLDALTEHFVGCSRAPVARGGGFEHQIARTIAANQLSFAVSGDVFGVSERA